MKLKLHWRIIIGLVSGTLFGIFAAWNHWAGFTQDWIAPFGTIFVNLLKFIAVPLVFSSLVTGIAPAQLVAFSTSSSVATLPVSFECVEENLGVPSAGVALILGVDRILDMVRTATNVTGDCTVTAFVDASEKRARESA